MGSQREASGSKWRKTIACFSARLFRRPLFGWLRRPWASPNPQSVHKVATSGVAQHAAHHSNPIEHQHWEKNNEHGPLHHILCPTHCLQRYVHLCAIILSEAVVTPMYISLYIYRLKSMQPMQNSTNNATKAGSADNQASATNTTDAPIMQPMDTNEKQMYKIRSAQLM